MIRNRLFAVVAIIASVVLTACSDMTAPKNDAAMPNHQRFIDLQVKR